MKTILRNRTAFLFDTIYVNEVYTIQYLGFKIEDPNIHVIF